MIKFFLSIGADVAIITLGGEGALIKTKDGPAYYVKAFP